MKKYKDVNIFKNFIKIFVLLSILFLIKGFYYPDIFAPEEVNFLIRKYEDEVMIYSRPILFAAIVSLIFYFLSFILLYRLNKKGRAMNIISLIVLSVCLLEMRFVYTDSLDAVMDSLVYMLNGAILTLAYFGSVSKKFK